MLNEKKIYEVFIMKKIILSITVACTLVSSSAFAGSTNAIALGTFGGLIGNAPGVIGGAIIGSLIPDNVEPPKPIKTIKTIKIVKPTTPGVFFFKSNDTASYNGALSNAKKYIYETGQHAEIKSKK